MDYEHLPIVVGKHIPSNGERKVPWRGRAGNAPLLWIPMMPLSQLINTGRELICDFTEALQIRLIV